MAVEISLYPKPVWVPSLKPANINISSPSYRKTIRFHSAEFQLPLIPLSVMFITVRLFIVTKPIIIAISFIYTRAAVTPRPEINLVVRINGASNSTHPSLFELPQVFNHFSWNFLFIPLIEVHNSQTCWSAGLIQWAIIKSSVLLLPEVMLHKWRMVQVLEGTAR